MTCKMTTVRAHRMCRCGRKFAKMSRCGHGRKRHARRHSGKGACVPGTKKRVGHGCGCKTRGGGFRILKKRFC